MSICRTNSALRSRLTAFGADDRGGIAIISAAFFMVGIGVSALAIDLGSLYLEKRRAQSFTDLAAMAAAADIDNAEAAARATLTANNIDLTAASLKVQLGNYNDNLPANARFKAGVLPYNAASVSVTKPGKIFFAKTFMSDDCCNMTVAAISATDQHARYTIGTRLASVNGGIVNDLLGGLLGGSINLSVMDYNALASANVDLLDLGNALAAELNLTGATYSDLLGANATVGNVLNALIKVTQNNGNTTANAAVKTIKAQSTLNSAAVKLGNLLGAGIGGGSSAQSSVMDIVTATATIANSGKMVDIGVNASIPGVVGLKLSLTIGEPMQQSGWAQVGGEGAMLRTAQMRIRLLATLAGAVRLPIDIDAAYAEANLANIACAADGTGAVTVSAKPGIVAASIGDNTAADGKATIVDLGIAKIVGKTATQVTNTSASNLMFSQADINAKTTKNVSTHNISETLVSSLVSSLALEVKALGIIVIPINLAPTKAILTAAATPLDGVVNTLLQTLGIRLGQVDVRVQGVRCDGSMLAS